MVFQQIKVLILSIVGLLRRALCCFSRKRKPSYSEPMTNVVVQPNLSTSSQRTQKPTVAERDWNSWDDSPRTVEEHIEQYRQHIVKPPTPQTEEEPDFFKELTPHIKPQPKYYLAGDSQTTNVNFSRLEAKTDIPITLNAELEDWVDEDIGGWEEMDTEQAKQLIREKRREMRNMRQKILNKSPQMTNNLQTSGFRDTQVTS